MIAVDKGFAEMKKVLFLKQRNPPCEALHWWGGVHSADPAIRPIMKCSVRISPGQESIDLRVKQQTLEFRSQQRQAHISYQALLKNKRVETKNIKMTSLSLSHGATF